MEMERMSVAGAGVVQVRICRGCENSATNGVKGKAPSYRRVDRSITEWLLDV
jgi:hypothetical protein